MIAAFAAMIRGVSTARHLFAERVSARIRASSRLLDVRSTITSSSGVAITFARRWAGSSRRKNRQNTNATRQAPPVRWSITRQSFVSRLARRSS